MIIDRFSLRIKIEKYQISFSQYWSGRISALIFNGEAGHQLLIDNSIYLKLRTTLILA